MPNYASTQQLPQNLPALIRDYCQAVRFGLSHRRRNRLLKVIHDQIDQAMETQVLDEETKGAAGLIRSRITRSIAGEAREGPRPNGVWSVEVTGKQYAAEDPLKNFSPLDRDLYELQELLTLVGLEDHYGFRAVNERGQSNPVPAVDQLEELAAILERDHGFVSEATSSTNSEPNNSLAGQGGLKLPPSRVNALVAFKLAEEMYGPTDVSTGSACLQLVRKALNERIDQTSDAVADRWKTVLLELPEKSETFLKYLNDAGVSIKKRRQPVSSTGSLIRCEDR